MKKSWVIALGIFAIAMGFLEAAVVVYLRALYYPTGFNFPLTPMSNSLLSTELFRELATLIMLASIAYITSKNLTVRFATFIFTFGIWDIFYYLFLKIILDWPQSLFTWDILFLLPVTWSGPVIAPIIVSVTFIVLAMVIYYFHSNNRNKPLTMTETLLFIAGSLIIFYSFISDFLSYIATFLPLIKWFNQSTSSALLKLTYTYIPNSFYWYIFLAGELIYIYLIIKYLNRGR